MEKDINIETLISWLGANGAKEGLKKSTKLTLNELKKIAKQCDVKINSKINRNDLINLIILKYSKNIDKPFSELINMKATEISEYLANTNCTKEELSQMLIENNIPFKKSLSKIALIHYAADEISNIGIYKRISENN